ncbi:hypothetical protein F0562_025390 [Nyssa sinensis]|uniref:Uncharacterized protein n=1 Tax=Nyssa sinensis TaxID=561372 RepID=A0A5J5BI08_9ASTE|nr:hypothetical protein F0562_025390 [Nyssa sinensis]
MVWSKTARFEPNCTEINTEMKMKEEGRTTPTSRRSLSSCGRLSKSVEAARKKTKKALRKEVQRLGGEFINYGYKMYKKKLINLHLTLDLFQLDDILVSDAEMIEDDEENVGAVEPTTDATLSNSQGLLNKTRRMFL